MKSTWIPTVLLILAVVIAGCVGTKRERTDVAAESTNGQRHEITVDGSGFHPNVVKLSVGIPATLVLTRTTDETCAKEIVVPSLNIRRALPLNTPVAITLTPNEKGSVRFACGMDMLSGVLQVE